MLGRNDGTDFALALGFAGRAGRAESQLNRNEASMNRLITAHRQALRRIADLERELEMERATRLAMEINAERRGH